MSISNAFTSIRLIVVLTIFLTATLPIRAGDDKFERDRMEGILDLVSKDIQKYFYDPALKGLDWAAVTGRARQRIRQAEHLGDMISAIASVPFQLNDSHTYFIPPQRSVNIGYGFEAQPIGNDILVYKLKKDGPGAKAGLELGDQILGVNGFAAKRGNFFEMMRYFRFLNPATEMTLEVSRGGADTRTIKIPTELEVLGKNYFGYNETRRLIDAQEPVYTYSLRDKNVAYIKLRAFMLSASEVRTMVSKARGADAVILDLRGNGGGSHETLTALAGCFTQQPYEMGKQVGRGKTEVLQVKPTEPQISAPLFVLIDSSSASAAEMLARSTQIRKRGIVIGDNSSGRVNMARVFWEKIGAFDMVGFGTVITVARVVMTDGGELETRGVKPDEPCIPTPDDLRKQNDNCLTRALELARMTLQSSQTH